MGLLSRLMTIFENVEQRAATAVTPPMGGSIEPRSIAERRRALGNIGHPDVLPPSPEFLSLARENAAAAFASGAIAARWHSSKYYEPYGGHDHPERDLKVYAIRGNWAMRKGFMRAGPDGYEDEITAPCEEPGCQCHYEFLFHLRDLPELMVTGEGRSELARVAATLGAMKKTR